MTATAAQDVGTARAIERAVLDYYEGWFDRRLEIEIDDVQDEIASVTVRSAASYEYLHLVRTRGGWTIAGASWRSR